jgi:hypothetical protein
MAYEDNQNENALPTGDDKKKTLKSNNLLPKYFRTTKNNKFLDATLDQILQPGTAQKLNGYYGRKTSKSYRNSDNYVGDVSDSRSAYQLEPTVLSKDAYDNVTFYKDYNDYVNQIKAFGGNTDNHSLLNSAEFYAWNPNLNWDKLTNFREYYWLPSGPTAINVAGQSTEVTSTFNVTSIQNGNNLSYVVNGNLTQNPTIELFKGQTYKFNISATDMPFTIRTERSLDSDTVYETGISNDNIEEGILTFTVPLNAPTRLYYQNSNNINAGGIIRIAEVDEATEIDVVSEIIGKATYTTSKGVELLNGMKLNFVGTVEPAIYASGNWIVEGVGDAINLVNTDDLVIALSYATDLPIEFDGDNFDSLPFGNAASYSATKDYVVVNRNSPDKNAWSRNNKWYHKSVIEKSAEINGQDVTVDQAQRAKRPIIEFNSGLKLFNFGTEKKDDIDLVDTVTKDIFSTIEGSGGYNIDGIDITDGMRILFTAEQDIRATGKIYKVKFINHNSQTSQIALIEDTDATPLENQVVLVKKGTDNAGKHYHFNGTLWVLGQLKTKVNQSPLFDLFDATGVSYADATTYNTTTFKGNKIFSYKEGTGTVDTELGFPLTYRALTNVGDITFNFDLLTETSTYQSLSEIITVKSDSGFLRKYTSLNAFTYNNGWEKAKTECVQKVVRQYDIATPVSQVEIDVYDKAGDLNDLTCNVLVNNTHNFDYTISRQNGLAFVVFEKELSVGDTVILRTSSDTKKNTNGYYEFPVNLEHNPNNINLTTFTLGEVNDHVFSMIEDLPNFAGIFPGNSNLGSLGNINVVGKKFVQHAGPINNPLYHITTKEANVVKSIDYAKNEFRTFKRSFIQTAETLGYDGPIKIHVDKILAEVTKNKTTNDPFYFSDMVPFAGNKRLEFTVYDTENTFFSLSKTFDKSTLSNKAVTIYQNGLQLAHGRDYTFNNDGFAVITATKVDGDLIEIFEYESTDGCFIPSTPSKLGLYPATVPEIITDDTYRTPTTIIIGHDGSRTVAFNDYRDNLILDLERRIFNNIKTNYDTTILDIDTFIPGAYRSTKVDIASINNTLLSDFIKWSESLGGLDYTSNNFWQVTDSFTYNYSYMSGPNGETLTGFWRSIYKHAYDTDTPHTTPWKIIGFNEKPTWWNTVYGAAPYTSDNLILWEDLEEGKVAEPGKPARYLEKYVRPGLTKHIPVDENGNLLSPLQSKYANEYISSYTKLGFKFGDHAPTETAWRNSSDYAFSIIKSWLLNRPAKFMSLAWDVSRISKNLAGQLIYSENNRSISLKDLVFSNVYGDTTRVYTSGLVDYIINYTLSNSSISTTDYKEQVKNLKYQLGMKLGAFTDNNKIKFLLDSRTPFNKGNVFLPKENFQIFLNTSSPIDTVSYSGVIVEKQSYGYVIKGYDRENPIFKINQAQPRTSDPAINVGGVSESFVDWDEGKRYTTNKYVRHTNGFYRVIVDHTSGTSFETANFTKIPDLPMRGGATALFRKNFESTITEVPYGTIFDSIQDVMDFILGYANQLKTAGFEFDYYNSDTQIVEDWRYSAKEFLFWTTQNWAAGTIIALSPSANQLKFKRPNCVVDNLTDNFYDYALQDSSGRPLDPQYTRLTRQTNRFAIDLANTAEGIYYIQLPLVQVEHVAILDNVSDFKDVIYSPASGYRQDRIKVMGYRTAGWDGTLNIPGFVYDQAEVTEWKPFTDYAIGDTVRYKEFYYSAISPIAGGQKFVPAEWNRMSERPTPGLYTNFDYRVNQFTDFYDLDSDNFDSEQQKMAQHLIGYQKRQYLENIINDDVSQYKFYQGFIADKGSRNSIDKLFDALASADKESVDFYEEWAVKNSQYGSTDNFEEVEWQLDESKFKLTPQPIELVETLPTAPTDLIYRIPNYDVFLKPSNYDSNKIPTKYTNDEYAKTVGYVTGEDVSRAVLTKDSLTGFAISDINKNDYVWVATDNQTWDVIQHTETELKINEVKPVGDEVTLTMNFTARQIVVGDIFGVNNANTEALTTLDGFYKATKVEGNKVSFTTTNNDWMQIDETIDIDGSITIFTSQRTLTVNDANTNVTANLSSNELVWIDDDDNGKWTVLKNTPVYSEHQKLLSSLQLDSTQHGFGHSISVNDANNKMAIGIPFKGNGEVHIYVRPNDSTNFVLDQIIEAPTDVAEAYDGSTPTTSMNFGESVALSPDGNFVAIGSPQASNIFSFYKGEFQQGVAYTKSQIIKYGPNLYKAIQNIDPATGAIQFSSFDSYLNIVPDSDSSLINLLQTGDYKINDSLVNHMLIRAPKDAYEGSAVGDDVVLKWNNFSKLSVQGSTTNVQPFDGEFPVINDSFISDTHNIEYKVDNVLVIENFVNLPQTGDTLSSSVASGTVVYVANSLSTCTVYLSDVNGTFDQSGSVFVGTIRIGDYIEDYVSLTANLGGYWYINTPTYTTTSESASIFVDPGHGLVYQDLLTVASGRSVANIYHNITDSRQLALQDASTSGATISLMDQASFAQTLTYEGDPLEVFALQLSPLWTIRGNKEFTDTLSNGDTFNLIVDSVSQNTNFTDTAMSRELFDKQHTVYDLWDGYIDFTFDQFDQAQQLPFEPIVGDTVKDTVTGATAEVTFYKRQFNTVRIYVKNVTGTWSKGNDFNEDADIFRSRGAIDRNMGRINGVSLSGTRLGKIIVIEESSNFADASISQLDDFEYWFYNETTLAGIPRDANIPASNNRDWQLVTNIPVDNVNGTFASGLDQEGMFSIYDLDDQIQFKVKSHFTVPERKAYAKLGDEIQFTQVGNLYRLSVSSKGAGTQSNAGSIHFVKNGSEVVDTVAKSYDWQLDINPNFRGLFDSNVFYKQDEIVDYESKLYKALRNIASGSAFITLDWESVTDGTAHVGFIPTVGTNSIIGEEVFDPEFGIRDFARQFDQSKDGEVLVVSSRIQGNDSTGERVVVVYRRLPQGQMTVDQIIKAPYEDLSTGTFTGFGDSVSVSNDGEMIAIGEPFNDGKKRDQGKVYIYTLNNGSFTLTQEVFSPNNEQAEQFGAYLNFDGNQLAVTSLSGDIEIPTTYDNNTTVFDDEFTNFKSMNMDSGVIFVYERINQSLLFAQEFVIDEPLAINFGKNLLLNANHVYTAIPEVTDLQTYQGMIVDFRKTIGAKSWNTHRSPVDQVDISKIKSAFLYNIQTNTLIEDLDYIDPVQGKIAGPAEQELSYKTYYDPAAFSVGDDTVVIDEQNSWGRSHVGQLWWDLSAVKFYNYQQNNSTYQTNYWGEVFPGTSIEVYEWVESDILPSEWDVLADSETGIASGVSGTSRYGDSVYSQRLEWDSISKTSKPKYFYWVANKRVVPNAENRKISAFEVKRLIEDPVGQGHKFAGLMAKDRFVLFNCEGLLSSNNVAFNLRYFTLDNVDQNIHNEYQMLTQGVASSKPNRDIERKWFDSLIGYDAQFRLVPDPKLSAKAKYGVSNNPRQSMFINKAEAYKEVIERVNDILIKNIIVDEFNINDLTKSDPQPLASSRRYDLKIDTYEDLAFVGVAKRITSVLTPTIVDGKITSINIINSGRGYIDPTYVSTVGGTRLGPQIIVEGIGKDAVLESEINELGQIIKVNIIDPGTGYDDSTVLNVRNFSVLVSSDIQVSNKWSLYNYNGTKWNRTVSQRFDTNLYWNYANWYASGYNEFTEIKSLIDYSYQLTSIENDIGDTVKISSVGSGGWLLLEKIANLQTEDYTQNYKVVGKENATIQFKDTLYNTNINKTGFDTDTFDTTFYDNQPVTESRVVLETLRDHILVDNLEVHYNELFIASIRYAFSEQPNVDWAFKTSFIKAQHNVGDMAQKVTFKNDNIDNYQDYINEVKPFKTKIREYVSSYEKVVPTNSVVTDFDLPPKYDFGAKKIISSNAKVRNNLLSNLPNSTGSYPDKHWLENSGYEIKEVSVGNAGSNYTLPPTVSIEGGGGSGATAKAFLNAGKVSKIEVITTGNGYVSAPDVILNGSVEDGGTKATARAVLGNGKVRGTHIISRFDRVSGQPYYLEVARSETFTGDSVTSVYNLKWPMNLNGAKIKIYIDGVELLKSQYTYNNYSDDTKGYTRKRGRVVFTTPPKLTKTVLIDYELAPDLLSAQDRVQSYYKPIDGMIGKDISQLMQGVDFGGVEVKSFDFAGIGGFETKGFGIDAYDIYDSTFEDLIFYLDGSTAELTWTTPLENGVVYNVYKNNTRLDDANYPSNPTNPNAVMTSIIGDGALTSINIQNVGITSKDDDIFIIRKNTSDGSFRPDPFSYDTELTGGALSYSNAKGINASEIIVDGDGFITPMTTTGPEELVPGKIADTVDIKVFHRPDDGTSNVQTQFFTTDGVTQTYNIGIHPHNSEAVFVTLDNVSVSNYTINYVNDTITFTTAPTAGKTLSVVGIGVSGQKILDINKFVADGSTNTYATNLKYQEGVSHYVTIDGQTITSTLTKGTDGWFVINFNTAPQSGQVVDYGLFYTTATNFSATNVQTLVGDGSTTVFDVNPALVGGLPTAQNAIVEVNGNTLDAGYNVDFTITNAATREYQIQEWQFFSNSIRGEDIEVYLNNELLAKNIQYRWSSTNNSVKLSAGIASVGDVLDVFFSIDGEYAFGYVGVGADSTTKFLQDRSKIYFDTAPSLGDSIKITSFSNHDIQDIERIKYNLVNRTVLVPGTANYKEYINFSNGLVELRHKAQDSEYVWVLLNGTKLAPNVDYYVTEDLMHVKIIQQLSANDKVEYIQFGEEQLTHRFGFRQFKDILNRVHYKRLDNANKYKLAQDLNWWDTRIELVDASQLPEPGKKKQIPGVVFINGERIEYYVKQGNSLRQIRRGTLGTGVNALIASGTEVRDQSPGENVPYRDQTLTQVFTADGTTASYELDFTPTQGINEFEVFVAGRRLRKNAISSYQVDTKNSSGDFVTRFIAQDSAEGDVTLPVEFTLSGSTLGLTVTPEQDQKVTVVRRVGQTWTNVGESLADAENDVAQFLKARTTELPK